MSPAFTRHDLPADIAVFAGDFASQPLVFAHLLDVAPTLELDHVVVIQSGHATRLGAYFDAATVARLAGDPANLPANTLVLILPAAYAGLTCPLAATDHLRPLGSVRGTVPHLSTTP